MPGGIRNRKLSWFWIKYGVDKVDAVLERKDRSYKFNSQFYKSKIVTAKSSKVQSKLDKFLSKSWMKT